MSTPPKKKAKKAIGAKKLQFYSDLKKAVHQLTSLIESVEDTGLDDDFRQEFDWALIKHTEQEGTMVSFPNYELLDSVLGILDDVVEQVAGPDLNIFEKAEKYDKLMQREDIRKLLDGDGLSVLTP